MRSVCCRPVARATAASAAGRRCRCHHSSSSRGCATNKANPTSAQRFAAGDERTGSESKTSQTRPWYAGPHYYRPETQVFDRRAAGLIAPAPPAERWVTGVPIFDTIFKGQWLLPSPLGWAGMRRSSSFC